MDDWSEQVAEARSRQLESERSTARLRRVRADVERLRRRKEEHERAWARDKADVAGLEGLSLKALFYTVLGSKETQLEKERQELLTTRLRFEETQAELALAVQEVLDLETAEAEFAEAATEYERKLEQRDAQLREIGGATVRQLTELDELEGRARARQKELLEARAAAETASGSLDRVADALQSAKNWGTWDLFGGGMVATTIKHGRLDDARVHLARAQRALERLRHELNDLGGSGAPELEFSGFETFADYFLDGLLFDWLVQSKINRAVDRTSETRRRVRGIDRTLGRKLQLNHVERGTIAERRRTLLEEG